MFGCRDVLAVRPVLVRLCQCAMLPQPLEPQVREMCQLWLLPHSGNHVTDDMDACAMIGASKAQPRVAKFASLHTSVCTPV